MDAFLYAFLIYVLQLSINLSKETSEVNMRTDLCSRTVMYLQCSNVIILALRPIRTAERKFTNILIKKWVVIWESSEQELTANI